jgi:hypothetical protein
VKNTDDGRVAAGKDAQNATGAAAVGFGRVERDEYLIALHRAVHCIGWDENVTIGCGAFAFDPHKAEAVAVNIQAASRLFFLATMCLGNGPVIAIRLLERAPRRHLCKLFEQQATLASPAQTQFASQLFVVGTAGTRPRNATEEFRIGKPSRRSFTPISHKKTLREAGKG